MTFTEDDLLPLSALQHLLFCERQAALIHIERVWAENPLTVEGKHLHERVDSGQAESRGDLRVARGLPLRSFRLGLSGKADAVELQRLPPGEAGATLPGVAGAWRPFPVEYKRGRPKRHRADEVQLCAQALCLEEMLAVAIPEGALFYGEKRRRKVVAFDRQLRELTETTISQVHALLEGRATPPAVYGKKCEQCSLRGACLPQSCTAGRSVRKYLAGMLRGFDAKDAEHALCDDPGSVPE
jgi:CRISPR-associated exonuclease Cas4